MDLERLKQKEVALLLRVDPRSVRNYKKEDLPIPSFWDGREEYYRWDKVFTWWRGREFAALIASTKRQDKDVPSLAISEQRKEAALAEMAELKAAEARKELITRTEAVRFTASLITPARSYLLGIGARLRAKLGPEGAAAVDHEVRRSLKVLGGEGDDLQVGA